MTTRLGTRQPKAGIYALGVLGALIPVIVSSSYQLGRVELICIYILAALGMNLSFGYAGQFAIAQPAIMGTSAYCAGILSVELGWGPWLTLPVAVAVGVLLGMLLSIPGFRLRGWYLAITSFFAVAIFPDVINATYQWSGGTNGLGPISPFNLPGSANGSAVPNYELILLITVVVWLVVARLAESRWGLMIRALRDCHNAAANCGVEIPKLKLQVAGLAAFPVAVGGWLWAHTFQVISPDSFGLSLLLLLIAAVLLGGRGTLWGPVLGVIVFEGISLWIGPLNGYNQLILGAAVLVMATAFPSGLASALRLAAQSLLGLANPVLERIRPARPRAGDPERPPLLHPEVLAVGSSAHDDGRPVAIRVEGLTKSFGGLHVVEDVNIDLKLGAVHGLIGPNGSGKTTLLNMITGFVRPDSGAIYSGSQQIVGRSPYKIGAEGIRRSFQIPQLVGELSVVDNMRLGRVGDGRATVVKALTGERLRRNLKLRNAGEAEALVRVAEALSIDPATMLKPSREVSLGLRRIVEIGRAMMGDPLVICLDEPAAGLAPEDLLTLRTVLRSLADSGQCLLLIEHNLEFVGGVCDVVFQLEDGVLTKQSFDTTSRGAMWPLGESR